MRDQAMWSLGLGRWAGVRVRLHIFYFLFAAFTLFLGWTASRDHGDTDYLWLAAIFLGIHCASVVFHGFAHCHMALRFGTRIDTIVLGPLGEMNAIQSAHDPRRELAIVLAGPLANILICAACVMVILMRGEMSNLVGLLHPLQPTNVTAGGGLEQFVKISLWLNWILFLVNILPIFPQDGGRALRSLFLIVWPEMGPQAATVCVARAAQLIAFSLFIVAVFVRDVDPAGLVPIWFALVLLGIFLIFAAQHEIDRGEGEESDDGCFGYDFSQGYTSLDEKAEPSPAAPSSPIARWLRRRREMRLRRQHEQEEDEERCMDDVLSRLHEGGMKGLSAEDRRLLDRVSARYRSRKD